MSDVEQRPLRPEDIREKIQRVTEEPGTPYPQILYELSGYGKVRLTFFSYDQDTQAIFAAIGPTPASLPELTHKLATLNQANKALFFAMRPNEETRTYDTRLFEVEQEEYRDLYSMLEKQGAFAVT